MVYEVKDGRIVFTKAFTKYYQTTAVLELTRAIEEKFDSLENAREDKDKEIGMFEINENNGSGVIFSIYWGERFEIHVPETEYIISDDEYEVLITEI